VSDTNALPPVGVLIVTDDPPLLRLLDLVLLRDGFIVYCASQSSEAIDSFGRLQQEIDVVLLEVDMHGTDGVQTMAALRQIDPRVRCCLMTGGDAKYTVAELRAAGALHVFTKPFPSIADICQTLRTIARA
jgi:DNA-binding response OmpR family regulator